MQCNAKVRSSQNQASYAGGEGPTPDGPALPPAAELLASSSCCTLPPSKWTTGAFSVDIRNLPLPSRCGTAVVDAIAMAAAAAEEDANGSNTSEAGDISGKFATCSRRGSRMLVGLPDRLYRWSSETVLPAPMPIIAGPTYPGPVLALQFESDTGGDVKLPLL